MTTFATLGSFAHFVAVFVRASVVRPPPIARSIEEAYKIGVRSLPILLIISTFVGTNLVLLGLSAFAPLGGQTLLGMFVAMAGVREMGPIMVAAMVASKAGTEMASQIAVMRIREQIDALEVMAVNPHWYLITPRFIGIVMVLPALTLISVFTLFVASYATAVWQLNQNGEQFIAMASQSLQMSDLIYTEIKSVFFGIVICLVSCYNGFFSGPGPSGVGQATNNAVVVSACICAVINYLLSEVMYG